MLADTVGPDRVADQHLRGRPPRPCARTWCCWTPRRCSAAARYKPRGASQLADAYGNGYSRSHSRCFWGIRPHLLTAPDRTPRATNPRPRRPKARDVTLRVLPIGLRGGEVIIAENGYLSRQPAATIHQRHGALLPAPNRQDEPGHGPHPRGRPTNTPSRSSEPKRPARARTPQHPHPPPPQSQIATKLLALPARVWLNHQLNRPNRALPDLARQPNPGISHLRWLIPRPSPFRPGLRAPPRAPGARCGTEATCRT
jgi:hypothetical protein